MIFHSRHTPIWSVLMVLCAFADMRADNIFFVNTTPYQVEMNMSGANTCPTFSLSRTLEPGAIFAFDLGKCAVTVTATVHTLYGVQNATAHFSQTSFNRGTVVLSQNMKTAEYELTGPFQERTGANYTAFLVNATPVSLDYHMAYPTLFCHDDRGNLLSGQIKQFNIGVCRVSGITITTEFGTVSHGDLFSQGGLFVARPKKGSLHDFEIVGPLYEGKPDIINPQT